MKICEDHSLLTSCNGGLWKNNYRSGPYIGIFVFRSKPVSSKVVRSLIGLFVLEANRYPGYINIAYAMVGEIFEVA